MAVNLYGIPGAVYAPLGGASYTADLNGRISNVPDGDAVGLRASGCLDQATWLAVQQALVLSGPSSMGVTIYNITVANNLVNYPGAVLSFTSSAGVTLNVPFGLVLPYRCGFVAAGTGDVTPTAAAGVAINSVNGFTKTAGQYAYMELIGIAPNSYILTGDGRV